MRSWREGPCASRHKSGPPGGGGGSAGADMGRGNPCSRAARGEDTAGVMKINQLGPVSTAAASASATAAAAVPPPPPLLCCCRNMGSAPEHHHGPCCAMLICPDVTPPQTVVVDRQGFFAWTCAAWAVRSCAHEGQAPACLTRTQPHPCVASSQGRHLGRTRTHPKLPPLTRRVPLAYVLPPGGCRRTCGADWQQRRLGSARYRAGASPAALRRQRPCTRSGRGPAQRLPVHSACPAQSVCTLTLNAWHRPTMKRPIAAALLAVMLALAARAAVDDAGCAASLGYAIANECIGKTGFDPARKYLCPDDDCQKVMSRVANACVAEGYRLAEQVLAAVKADPYVNRWEAAAAATLMPPAAQHIALAQHIARCSQHPCTSPPGQLRLRRLPHCRQHVSARWGSMPPGRLRHSIAPLYVYSRQPALAAGRDSAAHAHHVHAGKTSCWPARTWRPPLERPSKRAGRSWRPRPGAMRDQHEGSIKTTGH